MVVPSDSQAIYQASCHHGYARYRTDHRVNQLTRRCRHGYIRCFTDNRVDQPPGVLLLWLHQVFHRPSSKPSYQASCCLGFDQFVVSHHSIRNANLPCFLLSSCPVSRRPTASSKTTYKLLAVIIMPWCQAGHWVNQLIQASCPCCHHGHSWCLTGHQANQLIRLHSILVMHGFSYRLSRGTASYGYGNTQCLKDSKSSCECCKANGSVKLSW